MACENNQGQDTRWTQNNKSTSPTIPSLDEISLNHLESCNTCDRCDGCNGRDDCEGHEGCDCPGVEFYVFTTFLQSNNTTRYVRDVLGAQFSHIAG